MPGKQDLGRQEPPMHGDDGDRRRLGLWSAFGLGVFAALIGAILGGLYLIYLLAVGEIFAPLYCQLQLSYFCPRPTWAVIAMTIAGAALVMWLFVILRVILVRVDPPDGLKVTASQAPELFGLIERVAGRKAAGMLDAIVIDTDCNAGVVASPTFGVLGPMKTRLVIGLPLMDAVDAEEFPALIGHEMAHLASHSGYVEAAVQRVMTIWHRVGAMCSEGWPPGGVAMVKFAGWYLQEIEAIRLRLSRRREFEADAAAAAGHGMDASATVILRVAVAALWFDRMWDRFPARIRRHPAPRFRPFHTGPRWFRRLDRGDHFERLMRVVLVQATGRRDTHPAYEERIAALGPNPQVPPPVRVPASGILGEAEAELRQGLHDLWSEQVDELWRDGHENAKQAEEQLAAFEREAKSGEISPEDARAMAHLVRDVQGAAVALMHYRIIVEGSPDDAEMLYCLGESLLDLGNEEGLVHLDRARVLDPGLASMVIALASDFLASNGDMERARAYCADLDGALDELDLAGDERGAVMPDDVLDPHGLDRASVAWIHDCIAGIKGPQRAWLARKRVERLQARPYLVLMVEYGRLRSWFGSADRDHEKLLAACADLPFDMFVLRRSFGTRKFLANMRTLPGAEIFSRDLPGPHQAREPA